MKKTNNWVLFVKEFAKKNNIKYNEAIKKAKPYYNEYKLKNGGGVLSDTVNLIKSKGKELIKQEANKIIDEGVKMAKKKIGLGIKQQKGKGIIGDVLKYTKSAALNVVPVPNIVRDVANYAGDKVIEQSGLGVKRKTKSGGALYPSGFS